GGGRRRKIDGKSVFVGKEKFLSESKITVSEDLKKKAKRLQENAQTTVWVSINAHAIGVLGIADPIKETTRQAIRDLHAMGLKVIMCTGDNQHTAESVADQLGIDDFSAEVNPRDKIDIVNKLRSQGAIVAMAGDGINDAPALAAANLGRAMGTGSDMARQRAGNTPVKVEPMALG